MRNEDASLTHVSGTLSCHFWAHGHIKQMVDNYGFVLLFVYFVLLSSSSVYFGVDFLYKVVK